MIQKRAKLGAHAGGSVPVVVAEEEELHAALAAERFPVAALGAVPAEDPMADDAALHSRFFGSLAATVTLLDDLHR